jgi:hypothetical protein
MAKARNSFEEMARKGAARLDKVREAGQQLALLPDEAGATPVEVGTGKPGRPKGATGKGSSQLRRWLAAEGYRMPEEQLARIAALDSDEGPMLAAMAMAERVLAWSFDGAQTKDGGTRVPEPEQRLAVFLQCYAQIQRAAEALLPYGTPKAAPESGGAPVVQVINMPGAAAPERADRARDVTPGDSAMAPADVRWKVQQKQGLGEASPDDSDDGGSDA